MVLESNTRAILREMTSDSVIIGVLAVLDDVQIYIYVDSKRGASQWLHFVHTMLKRVNTSIAKKKTASTLHVYGGAELFLMYRKFH